MKYFFITKSYFFFDKKSISTVILLTDWDLKSNLNGVTTILASTLIMAHFLWWVLNPISPGCTALSGLIENMNFWLAPLISTCLTNNYYKNEWLKHTLNKMWNVFTWLEDQIL